MTCLHVLIHVTHLSCRFLAESEKTHNSNPVSWLTESSSSSPGLPINPSEWLNISDILSDFCVAPSVRQALHSFCRGVLVFSPWRRGSRVGVAGAISVPRRWHGADRSEVAPDYRTDVFHLGFICWHILSALHARTALHSSTEGRSWDTRLKPELQPGTFSLRAAVTHHSQ